MKTETEHRRTYSPNFSTQKSKFWPIGERDCAKKTARLMTKRFHVVTLSVVITLTPASDSSQLSTCRCWSSDVMRFAAWLNRSRRSVTMVTRAWKATKPASTWLLIHCLVTVSSVEFTSISVIVVNGNENKRQTNSGSLIRERQLSAGNKWRRKGLLQKLLINIFTVCVCNKT